VVAGSVLVVVRVAVVAVEVGLVVKCQDSDSVFVVIMVWVELDRVTIVGVLGVEIVEVTVIVGNGVGVVPVSGAKPRMTSDHKEGVIEEQGFVWFNAALKDSDLWTAEDKYSQNWKTGLPGWKHRKSTMQAN